MNLIEALRQANGKPIRRKGWDANAVGLVVNHFDFLAWAEGPAATVNMSVSNNILADDWYVVEPKSKIEEAIERELEAVHYLINGPAHKIINRVVNLALDEAKKCNKQTFCEICEKQFAERIDALKVKE